MSTTPSSKKPYWPLPPKFELDHTGMVGKLEHSVEKASRHVAQTQVLAGYPNPRRRYGTKDLDLPFQHLLKSMRDYDPVPRPQVVLPVDTIAAAAAAALQPLASPTAKATGDLITAAFCFLLRVGEYTMPSANRRTQTVQFQCQDVRLWRHRQLIPHTAPLEVLMMADSVTLYLNNQKNGQRGATIHHTSVPGWLCPVKCLARRVASIHTGGMPDSTPLSYVSPGTHVVADHIFKAVCAATIQTCLTQNAGYALDRIGSHSLRASGAMVLKLNGYRVKRHKGRMERDPSGSIPLSIQTRNGSLVIPSILRSVPKLHRRRQFGGRPGSVTGQIMPQRLETM
eukprot:scaffold9089_cov61-Attheya_sp.AAC.1